MNAAAEYALKHARLMAVLDEAGADGIELSSAGALSWLLCGARVHVSVAGPPILRAVAHRDGVEIAVFSNEAERIASEELGELAEVPEFRIHELAWHDSLDEVASWLPISLPALVSEPQAALALRNARAALLEPEVVRYRSLCQDSAAALTDVLHEVSPRTTEREVAAALSQRLVAAGADPVVLLVNGASRAQHRHPLPTAAPLGERAMAVVCARRDGLIANITRWVRFGAPSVAEQDFDAAILQVEADVFEALTPGAPLESVLNVLKSSYGRRGFSPAEWSQHHQGGAAGYQGRDPRVSPGIPDAVQADQAFAWNPSSFSPDLGFGFKVEDTVLLRAGDYGGRIDVLSTDDRWPTAEVRGRRRPLVLQR